MPLDFLKSPAAQLAAKVLGGGAIGAGVLGGLGEFNNNDQDPARRAAQRKRNLLLGAALGGLGGGALAGYDKLVKPELNKTPPPENPYLGHSYYNGVKNLGDFPLTAGGVAGVGANALQNSRNLQNAKIPTDKANLLYDVPKNPGTLPVSPYVPHPPPVHPGPVAPIPPLPPNDPRWAPGDPFSARAKAEALEKTMRAQTVANEAHAKAVAAHAASEAKGLADHGSAATKAQVEADAAYAKQVAAAEEAALKSRNSVLGQSGLSGGSEGWVRRFQNMQQNPVEMQAFADKNYAHIPDPKVRLAEAKAELLKRLTTVAEHTPSAGLVEHALHGQMGNFSGPLISRRLITDPRHLLGHSAAYWRGSPRARILATAAGAAGLTETAGRALKTNSPLERWHLGGDKLDAFLDHQKAQAPTTSPTSSDSRFKMEIK